MSKIVDDFIEKMCYSGSMEKAEGRNAQQVQMSKIVDDFIEKVCYSDSMEKAEGSLVEIPAGFFRAQKGGIQLGRKNNRKEVHIRQPRIQLNVKPRRMEIWFANLEHHFNSNVQGGPRPVLIVSNEQNNAFSNTVTVLPLTSKMKRPEMPTHTWLRKDDLGGDCYASMVLAEQITTIDKKCLSRCMGFVSNAEKMKEIEKSMQVQILRGENV